MPVASGQHAFDRYPITNREVGGFKRDLGQLRLRAIGDARCHDAQQQMYRRMGPSLLVQVRLALDDGEENEDK